MRGLRPRGSAEVLHPIIGTRSPAVAGLANVSVERALTGGGVRVRGEATDHGLAEFRDGSAAIERQGPSVPGWNLERRQLAAQERGRHVVVPLLSQPRALSKASSPWR